MINPYKYKLRIVVRRNSEETLAVLLGSVTLESIFPCNSIPFECLLRHSSELTTAGGTLIISLHSVNYLKLRKDKAHKLSY